MWSLPGVERGFCPLRSLRTTTWVVSRMGRRRKSAGGRRPRKVVSLRLPRRAVAAKV